MIRREFSSPKTPYQRIMECQEISKEIKGSIKSIYESLNYIELKEKRNKLVEELINLKMDRKLKIEEQEYELCA